MQNHTPLRPEIGLLVIATGKYNQYVDAFIEGVKKCFFPSQNVHIYLFTDQPRYFQYEVSSIRTVFLTSIEIEHEQWPGPTLHRYKHFVDHANKFNSNTSHLFYCDIDAKFIKPFDFWYSISVGSIGENFIIPIALNSKNEYSCLDQDKLVLTQHCGFPTGGWGSPNTPIDSTAYVPVENQREYMMGGFQGGHTKAFLDMAAALSHNIAIDEQNGVMAEWHDESHLNAYWILNKEKVGVVLPPTFFMGELMQLHENTCILSLEKDHLAMRS